MKKIVIVDVNKIESFSVLRKTGLDSGDKLFLVCCDSSKGVDIETLSYLTEKGIKVGYMKFNELYTYPKEIYTCMAITGYIMNHREDDVEILVISSDPVYCNTVGLLHKLFDYNCTVNFIHENGFIINCKEELKVKDPNNLNDSKVNEKVENNNFNIETLDKDLCDFLFILNR